MDKKRISVSVRKAFLISTSLFGFTVVLTALAYAIMGELIFPSLLIRVFIIFSVIFILTSLKIYISGTRSALRIPYVVINLIFLPFYMGTTLTGLFLFNNELNIAHFFLYVVLFLATFTIVQLISYLIQKAKTDEMNDALEIYKKEHRYNGDEE